MYGREVREERRDGREQRRETEGKRVVGMEEFREGWCKGGGER